MKRSVWRVQLALAYLALLAGLAIFAPQLANKEDGILIRYDPGAADPFARSLPPGAPKLRVLPLGPSAGPKAAGLTQLTPIGDGAYHTGVWQDLDAAHVVSFALVPASQQRFVVAFMSAPEPARVAERIVESTGGLVTASYDERTRRLTLHDHTTPGPVRFLGTDAHGADVAAGMIHAAQTAIVVAVVATLVAFVLGVIIGTLMGALGGWADFIGLRIIETASAVPRLLLLVIVSSAVSAACGEHMLLILMATLGATSWMTPARLVRGELMRVREAEYVLAARAVGVPRQRMIMRHMLPGALGPVLVEATFYASAAVLIETNLSFLGLGVQPPGTSWGAMLADAVDRSTGAFRWWIAAGPGLMVFLTILSIHTVGEHLRTKLKVKPSWNA